MGLVHRLLAGKFKFCFEQTRTRQAPNPKRRGGYLFVIDRGAVTGILSASKQKSKFSLQKLMQNSPILPSSVER